MPEWKHTIKLGDVFHNEEIPFAQRRAIITERLRTSRWNNYRKAHEDIYDPYELDELLEELNGDGETEVFANAAAEYEAQEEFDMVWAEVYALADAERCWIDTFS